MSKIPEPDEEGYINIIAGPGASEIDVEIIVEIILHHCGGPAEDACAAANAIADYLIKALSQRTPLA
jgi:hypothetical protein